MSIEHIWNGTVLTVTSDSGTSSADLQGIRGATGPRGPQGPAGVILNEQGQVQVDLSPYCTEEEVNAKIADAAFGYYDIAGYPTEDDVAAAINSALGPYATKHYVVETVQGADNLINYYTKSQVDSKITSGTEELEAGVSYLPSGTLHVVYE